MYTLVNIMNNFLLNPNTTMLLIIDMQNDFCHKNGSLYVENANNIIPNLQKFQNFARNNRVLIGYTADSHDPDDKEFNIWPKHCINGEWGAQIIDELRPSTSSEEHVFKKRRYSGFYGTDLDLYLREHGIDTLIVTGVVSNICVLHTVGDATARGYKVIVLVDCIAALSEYEQEYALHHIKSVFNASIANSEDIKFY